MKFQHDDVGAPDKRKKTQASPTFILFLLLYVLSPITSALDFWSFSLCGLNHQSRLVCLSPDGHEDENTAFMKDNEGNFKKIKINAFLDRKSRTVFRRCIWDRTGGTLECQGGSSTNVPIKYVGKPIEPGAETLERTEQIEVRTIQNALVKAGTCHRGETFFTCRESCSPNIPKNLLLVYCGD